MSLWSTQTLRPTNRPFTEDWRVCAYAWRRSVGHRFPHWLPGVHPYHCSSLLSPLVSMHSLRLLIGQPYTGQPAPTHHQVRAKEDRVHICSWRRPTDGRQHRARRLEPLARNSGGKDRQKTRRGRRREAEVDVGGKKQQRRRRRFMKCSDLFWRGFSYHMVI